MTTRPGEDLAAILFTDVHYFHSPPTSKPLHDRFDKGSYVYLFENAQERRARIEIANYAGTPDQDAFDGHLDEVRIRYSFKHPTLISFTIEKVEDQEWHLLSYDLKNEHKHLYKLHTVDLYLWTYEDAIQLLNAIRRLLPQQQITVLDEPVAPQMHYSYFHKNPALQKLDHKYIADPSFLQRRALESHHMLPGPPISATPNNQHLSNYAPLAYNPAAPAAPESISYREKTPPIEDGGFHSLRAAISSDQKQPAEICEPTYQNNKIPNTLETVGSTSERFIHTSPKIQPSTMLSTTSHYQSSSTDLTTNHPTPSSQFQAPSLINKQLQSNIPVTQYANYPISPGVPRIMSTPSLFSSEINFPVITPEDDLKYLYINDSKNPSTENQTDYSVNQTTCRVIENNVAPKSSKPLQTSVGKMEEHTTKFERRLGSMIKKLERKIG
ncbi:hypothetical protein GcM3_052003 [Golovinomyces cichoracearum]|uniref:Rna recognition motif-containing protein n=1 Tax=Golovinomyces cichoracearum TaxID=62708 RepID=A0A420IZ02_9PEZI|nr:hypothetical protein GcM3_052003 [Golovinomyces cichoracearum]